MRISAAADTSGRKIMEARPLRPWLAVKSVRNLIREPDDTTQVFHIIQALSGNSFERLFWRVYDSPQGQRVIDRGTSLLSVLEDREALMAMPPGSLGRTYADFVAREHISADGLVEASEVNDDQVFLDPRAEILSERLRDMHDLWHVVTGWGRDLLGEGSLLGFTYAQLRNPGIGFIVVVGVFKFLAEGTPRAAKLFWLAYRRGKAAGDFCSADWEAMLHLPLGEVRRLLNVEPAPDYEPIYSTAAAQAPARVQG